MALCLLLLFHIIISLLINADFVSKEFHSTALSFCSLKKSKDDLMTSYQECALLCVNPNCDRFVYCSGSRQCVLGGNLPSTSLDCKCYTENDTDCTEATRLGLGTGVQVTYVKPDGALELFQVLCELDYAMTYIARRKGNLCTGVEEFHRTWAEYVTGFGDLRCDHWLGLDKIHLLTSRTKNKLNMLVDTATSKSQCFYPDFKVSDPGSDFTAHICNTTYDEFCDQFLKPDGGLDIDGKRFSTTDHNAPGLDCSSSMKSGWWFGPNCKDARCRFYFPRWHSAASSLLGKGILHQPGFCRFVLGWDKERTTKTSIALVVFDDS